MSGYIGNIPVPQATQTRQSFTATASQTTFNTAGYSVGYVDVFLNGVKLAPADYTATNGSDIILAVGAASGDILETVAYEIFQVVDQDFTGDFTVDGSTFVVDSTNNNVGIGTSSPSDQLDISGSSPVIRLSDTTDSSYSRIEVYSSDLYLTADQGGTDSGNMIFRTNGTTERMRIDSSGNLQLTSVNQDIEFNATTGTHESRLKWNYAGTLQSWIEREHSDGSMVFGNQGSERMRIDSSGNLLVGKSSLDGTGSRGIELRSDGLILASKSNAQPMSIDRNGTDGDILWLGKNGTKVGSIGSVASGANLYMSAASGVGLGIGGDNLYPVNASGASTNGSLDIGDSTARFKDLYLSGKIQLGGTGAENLYVEGTNPRLYVKGDSNSYYPSIRVTGINGGVSLGTYYGGNISGNTLSFLTGANTTDGGTRRMVITSSGDVAIGDTNPTRHGQTTKTLIYNGSGTTGDFALHVGRVGTGTENQVCFSNGYGKVGSITTSGTSTAYNTSSDYRLKENITDVTDGITRVKQLAPKRFNFIADPDTTVDGFIAHEVQDVIPEAISGAKDAMRDEEYEVTPAVEATFDEEGNVLTAAVDAVMGTRSVPDYQGIDQAKLVPLLTAALQEAIAKIETLETEMTSVKARLDALEAN